MKHSEEPLGGSARKAGPPNNRPNSEVAEEEWISAADLSEAVELIHYG